MNARIQGGESAGGASWDAPRIETSASLEAQFAADSTFVLQNSARSMRYIRRFYLLFLLLLSLGLFCGELPESVRLTDDVSNDFVEDSSAHASSAEEAAQAIPVSERAHSLTVQTPVFQKLSNNPEEWPAASSGRELLQLLSTQRK